ncbi:hypothetical protein PR048_010789 [Dryococelus australis]|uniref:Uncharacterized protein n=1 Tax=Dryococelus australis TaxID=614101 RepID=A0ABQ9I3P7_9NEOP|nr:hypothetical protein PR048_010789 [Dryococelus australis]
MYEQFLRKVPTTEQRQLLQLCSTSMSSYIKILIKIYNTESTGSIRAKHYYDIIMEHWDDEDIDTNALDWFSDFFKQNKIKPVTFYTNFIRIQSCMMKKINGFIVQGPTNAGKSTITRLLTQDMRPTLLTRERTPITTDIKHMDKEIIEGYRSSSLTTNTPIWNWLEASEIPPLKCRTFVYQFNTQIEHQTLSWLSMRKPPTILQPQHLYTHMLYHINEINEELAQTHENDMPGRNRPVHPHRDRSRSPVKKQEH